MRDEENDGVGSVCVADIYSSERVGVADSETDGVKLDDKVADGVSEADGVRLADGVKETDGVKEAEGVSDADGVRLADRVTDAEGVNVPQHPHSVQNADELGGSPGFSFALNASVASYNL